MDDIKDDMPIRIGILDSDLRKIYRNGGVSVDMAVMDSGLRETPHIADTDAWITMDDKGREAYSATAGEIHGQASFVATTGHYFTKVWDSIGFWIATRIASIKPANINNLSCVSQTHSIGEETEKTGADGVVEGVDYKICFYWLKQFETRLMSVLKNG